MIYAIILILILMKLADLLIGIRILGLLKDKNPKMYKKLGNPS